MKLRHVLPILLTLFATNKALAQDKKSDNKKDKIAKCDCSPSNNVRSVTYEMEGDDVLVLRPWSGQVVLMDNYRDTKAGWMKNPVETKDENKLRRKVTNVHNVDFGDALDTFANDAQKACDNGATTFSVSPENAQVIAANFNKHLIIE